MVESLYKEQYKNEDALCVAFMKNINNLDMQGCIRHPDRFQIIHIANQQVRIGGDSKYHMIMGKRLKDMGRKAGVFDYYVTWSTDGINQLHGYLEAKMPKKYLEPAQKAQKEFYDRCGLHNDVFRSVQEGLRILKGWGVIKGNF